jgi:hypothetical protein
MIALQARNPQLPDPSRQTAQFANMMNMSRQAEAAALQGQRIRQEMQYAEAAEGRAVETQKATIRGKNLDNQITDMKRLRNIGVAVLGSRSEEGYQSWVDMVEASDPQLGATIRQVAPTFNPDIMNYLIAEADKYIDKNIPQRTSKSEFDANGNLIIIDQGGFDPAKIRAGVITDQPDMPRPQTEAPRTPTAPQASAMGRGLSATSDSPMTFGPDETRPLNATQQEDLRRVQSETGMTDTPASFTRGGMGAPAAAQMTPERAQQIVDSAVRTRVMAQEDFDQLMAMAPEQNKQPFMDMIQANNITLQPGGMGQQPQSQFADLRGAAPQSQTAGLRGAPPMEQTLAQYQVGQQVKGRNPNLSPYPGSAQVPIERVRQEAVAGRITPAEEAAKKRATTQVEIEMAPELAKATKTAERAVELKSTATRAKYATEGILSEVADRINTIDQLLRNPNRFSIVGAIEGNLPRLLQTGARADAQAAFDKIKNTATLTSLIDMRKSTETGASPVGANPTDKDAKIVEQAASKLIQTGEPATFDAELIDMRRKLYRTYQSAQREYDGVYGEVLKENPKLRLVVPKVSDRYISSKDLAKPRTSTKVDRNNPLLRD